MARFLAFILGVAGALIASQGPGFTLQYMQNLQGRVDQLQAIVENHDQEIAKYGYTRDAAIVECRSATDLLEAMCANYRTAVERYEYLTGHLAELEATTDYVRPLVLARSYDRDVALSVRKQFEPAVPATIHGAIYAAGGFVVAWGLPLMIFSIIGAIFSGGRRYA
ncbi:MAG: DUF2937 family protein [Pseudomonadota bacterium]